MMNWKRRNPESDEMDSKFSGRCIQQSVRLSGKFWYLTGFCSTFCKSGLRAVTVTFALVIIVVFVFDINVTEIGFHSRTTFVTRHAF